MTPWSMSEIVTEPCDGHTVDILLSDPELGLQALEAGDLSEGKVGNACA